MSSHIFSDEQLIAFALNEMDAAESERVASHVAECAQCRATVASFQGIRALLHADDSVAVPPATLARAQAIFRQHAAISRPGWSELIRRGPLPRARQLIGISTLATLLLTLALLYSSARLVAPAVQATLPGDALYPVKTTIEDVRIAVALDDSSRVQAQLSIAQARVTEISALVEQGRYDSLPKATQDYQEHVQQATSTLGQVLKQDPGQVDLAQRVEQDLARHEVSLAVLQENSPGDVKPQIRRAVIASSAAKSTVQDQLSSIKPSSAIPAVPLVTPIPNAVVTASSAPALPAATNTVASAPTVVITPPGPAATLSPSISSPTAASASPSNPASSPSPVASLTAVTNTVIPATPTASSTGTPVPPTSTRPPTMTSAPTATAEPTNTLPAATTTATTTVGASTPTLVSPLQTPTPAPTPVLLTPTPIPVTVSQTAVPVAHSPTPMPSNIATSTPPIGPTSTPPVATSSGSPSFTSTPVPAPTFISPGPSATTAPAGTLPATAAATPVPGATSATSVSTPAAPTPIAGSGTSSPSAGFGSAGGTQPLPVTPGSNTSSTAPAPGKGTGATSVPPAGMPSTSGEPTTTTGPLGKRDAPIAPTGDVGSPIRLSPAAVPPAKVPMSTTGWVTDLAVSKVMSAFCSSVQTDRRATDDRQMMCNAPEQSKSSLPPILFGALALLASLGIIIPTR